MPPDVPPVVVIAPVVPPVVIVLFAVPVMSATVAPVAFDEAARGRVGRAGSGSGVGGGLIPEPQVLTSPELEPAESLLV